MKKQKTDIHKESKEIFQRYLDQIDFGEWDLSGQLDFQLDDNWGVDQTYLPYPIKISAKNDLKLTHKVTKEQTKATIYISLDFDNKINEGTCCYFTGGSGQPIVSHRKEFNAMLESERLEESLLNRKNNQSPKKIKV